MRGASAIRHCWVFLAVLLLSLASRADLVVTQRIDGAGQSGEQTIRIKGDKARSDIGGTISILVDRQTGETTTLAHAQRGFLTLTPERNKAMLEKMRKAAEFQGPPKLVNTGKKEKIGESDCEIHTADIGAVKLTYWLAATYPNYQAILTQLDVLDSAPLAASNSGLAPRTRDLPGMPMKMTMETGGQKVTITLLSAKEENVDPGIFKIPPGYKEMPAPQAAPAP